MRCFWFIAVLATGCGKAALVNTIDGDGGDAASSDTSVNDMAVGDTKDADGAVSNDAPDDMCAGYTPDSGRYCQSNTLCCAKGEGKACCDGGRASDVCNQYGGFYGVCVAEGDWLDFKFLDCLLCCPGLKVIGHLVPIVDGGCQGEDNGPTPVFICAACGDGICNPKFENSCNCPEDCPK